MQIGQIIAVSSFVIVIAQPVFGFLADHIVSLKTLVLINLFASAVMTGLVYLFRFNFIILLICFTLISFSEKSLSSLIDSWISMESRLDNSINYGSSRGLGSFGAALFSIIGGVLIDQTGFGVLYILHVLLLLTAIIIVFGTPISAEHSNQIEPIKAQSGEKLYKNREYIRIVAAAAVLFLGVSVEITYFPILFQSCGGTSSQLGFALFIMSMSEVTVMSRYKRISSHISPEKLMLIALICYTFKLFFQIFMDSVILLILLQLIQGFTYGLFLPSLIALITKNSNEHNTSTAITVCFAVFNGGSPVAGNFIAGILSQQFGLRSAFIAAAFLCFCSVAIFLRKDKCLETG